MSVQLLHKPWTVRELGVYELRPYWFWRRLGKKHPFAIVVGSQVSRTPHWSEDPNSIFFERNRHHKTSD